MGGSIYLFKKLGNYLLSPGNMPQCSVGKAVKLRKYYT
jgi:hypothetical protein